MLAKMRSQHNGTMTSTPTVFASDKPSIITQADVLSAMNSLMQRFDAVEQSMKQVEQQLKSIESKIGLLTESIPLLKDTEYVHVQETHNSVANVNDKENMAASDNDDDES